jgi:Lon-like protease
MRTLRSPLRLIGAILAVAALAGAAVLLVPSDESYIVLPDRARPVSPLLSVAGVAGREAEDGIYFVDVIVRRASVVERVFPGAREGASLLPAHAVNPSGIPEDQRRRANLRQMSRSQEIAAAVALRELGYDVRIEENGALVDTVLPDGPSAGKLVAGDVILAVDGRPVETPDALREQLGERTPGDTVTLSVRRSDGRKRVRITTASAGDETGRAVVGIIVAQAAEIDIPLEIEIDAGRIGGPSAGLAFALAVYDRLGSDVDRGRRVAVTGALALDGTVQPVGGIKQKVIGARRSGADLFLVPAGDNAAEARANADGLRVVPVRSFQQALQILTTDGNQPHD